MEKNIIKKINISYFVFFSIFSYKINQIFIQDILIYYRQYDLFGLIAYGFGIYDQSIDLGNNFNQIRLISFSILILNLFSLCIFLKKLNLNFFLITLVSLIFIFFHNFQYRFYYGHIGLQIYFFIFFSSYVLLIERLYIIKKAIFISLILIFSMIISPQYIFYNLIILIFLFFSEKKKSGYYKIKLREIILLTFLTIFFLIILILVKKYYFINYDFSDRNWSLKDINKYSIINPLELIFNFKHLYSLLLDLIKSEEINLAIQKNKNFLKYYSPNGPEFTFFLGISLTSVIVFNQFKKIIEFNLTIPLILIINLVILNKLYPFSLIFMHEYLFPYIRSAQRALIIIDFLIIFNLAYFFKKFEKNKYLLIFFTFIIILEQEFNFNKSNIMINNNLFKFPDEIVERKLNFYSPTIEHKYISNYLKKNNNNFKITDQKENYNFCLIYDNCFIDSKNINNFFEIKID